VTQADAARTIERALESFAAWSAASRRMHHRVPEPEAERQAFLADLSRCLELDSDAALAHAAPYLSSRREEERSAAAWIVGEVGTANAAAAGRCVTLLLEQLRVETAATRGPLANGLAKIWLSVGDRETPMTLARDPNPRVRYAAAHALGLRLEQSPDDPRARDALLALRRDSDVDVRDRAEFGLLH
jgi:hypothetical protein